MTFATRIATCTSSGPSGKMSENLATDAADPVDPECAVHCVAFFYEEDKGGENYRWKNKFRCSINKEEKRLAIFVECIW